MVGRLAEGIPLLKVAGLYLRDGKLDGAEATARTALGFAQRQVITLRERVATLERGLSGERRRVHHGHVSFFARQLFVFAAVGIASAS